VVAAQIEPLTRFRAQDLKELGPEQDSWAELTVTTRQRVELDGIVTAHPGPLPDGITACTDAQTLETELQARLAEAERTAPALIQHWAHEDSGRYRRLLPGGLFSSGLEAPLGLNESCPACQGRCRIDCPDCSGGQQPCAGCHGNGRIGCADCRGLGRIAGSASGWVDCRTCARQGELPCPDCGGRGHRDCARCQVRGEIDCADCQACGLRHRIGRLREQILVEDQIDMHHPDATVVALCARHLADPAILGTLAVLEAVRWTTAPFAVQATHRLRLPVRQVTLQIGAQPQTFTAFGPDLQVPELHHAASRLLALDLQTLERNALGSGRHLSEALQRFLASPLNARIAVAGNAAATGDGRVAPDYPTQARERMQQAVERLWQQRLWRPGVALLAGAALLSGGFTLLTAPRPAWPLTALVGGVAAAASVLMLDGRLRRQLASELGGEAGAALVRLLQRAPVWRHGLGLSLGAMLLACALLAWSATRLPPASTRIVAQQAEQQAQTQLEGWAQTGRDYRLRHYPPVGWLRSRAETGDPQARQVLAWSLLLGIEATPVDAPQARRLLRSLVPDAATADPSVRIGLARATLLLEPRSATALQAAADDLASIQESQVPEATYTLALLRLAPALAARHGPVAGLEALQHAADMGHPSACLDLGRRLAAGHGLRRDPIAARRYLGFAAERGLPGAQQALSTLR
jgi:TPR repeat protein